VDKAEVREGFIVGCGAGMLIAAIVVMGLVWFAW